MCSAFSKMDRVNESLLPEGEEEGSLLLHYRPKKNQELLKNMVRSILLCYFQKLEIDFVYVNCLFVNVYTTN